MKLLYIAYKIEKDKGSEDGTGYNIASIMANKDIQITIITRQNNIEKLTNDPLFSKAELISVDVPKAFAFYKKGGRGIILYYFLWQICVGYKIYQLQKKRTFDVIHQLNFHALWAPHFIFSKSKIIWGPLTQHPRIPYRFWFENKSSYLMEWLKHFVKMYFVFFDPFLKWALYRSHHIILGQNILIGSYKKHVDKISYIPQARSVFQIIDVKTHSTTFSVLFVGRFVSLKCCIIALEALEKFILSLPENKQYNIEVNFIGSGNLHQEIIGHAQVIRNKTKATINILNWLDQVLLSEYYSNASLFLFPSFEAQGLVVAEAIARGCPVLCFENSGPHTVAGDAAITVPLNNLKDVTMYLADKLKFLADEYWNQPSLYKKRIELSLKRAKYLTWEKMANELMDIYNA